MILFGCYLFWNFNKYISYPLSSNISIKKYILFSYGRNWKMFVLALSSSPSTRLSKPNGPNQSPVRKILCLNQQRQSKIGTGKSWILPTSLSLFGSGFVLGPLLDGLHSRVDLVVYKNGALQIGPLHTNIWVTCFSRTHHVFEITYNVFFFRYRSCLAYFTA